jgi:hypothetical protein
MTIVEFLLARLAEDEQSARTCAGVYPAPWEVIDRGYSAKLSTGEPYFLSLAEIYQDQARELAWVGDALEHVARHDPARVLADCAAKRAIVEWHKAWPVLLSSPAKVEDVEARRGDPTAFVMRAVQQVEWTTQQEYVARFGTEPPTAPMLRHLAAVYSDHLDYRPEWAA